ncbi:MAG: helix-turn-helix transcriptional regulator [Anaerolineae bacterium]|nr:helix-turn-helix transcriptional regulator [Anaerolineae bacterium]
MPAKTKTTQHANLDVFTAIAHPVRRQILDRLAQGDLTVTELAQPFDVSRSAISQHLSILLESGLVTMQRQGREHTYRLRPENLNEVQRWISQYERFWAARLDALEAFLDQQAEDQPDETRSET